MYKAHTIIYHVYFKLDWEIYNVSSLRFRYLCTVCGRMNWFWENWPILPVQIYKYIHTMEYVKTIEQAATEAVAVHTQIDGEKWREFRMYAMHCLMKSKRQFIKWLAIQGNWFYSCVSRVSMHVYAEKIPRRELCIAPIQQIISHYHNAVDCNQITKIL